MELITTERPTIPDLITARIPEKLKPYISDLMLLERRKLATIIVMLLTESVSIKKKVHEHKHTLQRVNGENGIFLTFNREPHQRGKDYNESPGLNLTLNKNPNDTSDSIILSKESALVLAANLSIFLNEVNI